MTTSDPQNPPLIEVVTDDLLLTVDAVMAGDTLSLTSRVVDHIADLSIPAVNDYIRAHPGQRKGALAASSAFATAVSEYVGMHALLSSAVLSWASEKTGLSVAEVLYGARAHREGGS